MKKGLTIIVMVILLFPSLYTIPINSSSSNFGYKVNTGDKSTYRVDHLEGSHFSILYNYVKFLNGTPFRLHISEGKVFTVEVGSALTEHPTNYSIVIQSNTPSSIETSFIQKVTTNRSYYENLNGQVVNKTSEGNITYELNGDIFTQTQYYMDRVVIKESYNINSGWVTRSYGAYTASNGTILSYFEINQQIDNSIATLEFGAVGILFLIVISISIIWLKRKRK